MLLFFLLCKLILNLQIVTAFIATMPCWEPPIAPLNRLLRLLLGIMMRDMTLILIGCKSSWVTSNHRIIRLKASLWPNGTRCRLHRFLLLWRFKVSDGALTGPNRVLINTALFLHRSRKLKQRLGSISSNITHGCAIVAAWVVNYYVSWAQFGGLSQHSMMVPDLRLMHSPTRSLSRHQ